VRITCSIRKDFLLHLSEQINGRELLKGRSL